MTLPDNRLRFSSTKIDFTNDVGTTGQPHDSYPGPNLEPRYDWLRMWFISLLANQSSYDEPSNYRDGTIWFDLNGPTIKIYTENKWKEITEAINVSENQTLAEWISNVSDLLQSATPEMTFSGKSTLDGTSIIPIPESILQYVDISESKPFIYINGILVDPRNCSYNTSSTIQVNNETIDKNDRFTVVIKNIRQDLFYTPDVNIP